MSDRLRRKRRRWIAGFAYFLVWASAVAGAAAPDPRFLGIPAWYLWASTAMILLAPLNAWFVRSAWPEDAVHHRTRGGDEANV